MSENTTSSHLLFHLIWSCVYTVGFWYDDDVSNDSFM